MKKAISVLLAVVIYVSAVYGAQNALAASDIELADLGNNVQIHTDLQQSALDDKTQNILQYAKGAEELSHPKAITLSWTSSVSGTYTVKISENSNLSDAKTYTTTSKSLSLYNLKIGTKYYWQVSCGSSVSSTSSFTTSSSAPRNLYISKVTNCRDIGGWSTGSGSVKQGLLYRTAKLDSISDAGKSTMLDDLGIKTEIDLRETTEKGVGSSALGSSVKYCNVPMVNGGNRLTGNKEKVKDVFKILADKNNYPIVFHCSAGADRTGLIAFLINGLLGVSESDLVRDFSFTNFGNIGGSRGHDALNDYLPKIKKASGNTLAEQMYNYLMNDIGISAGNLDSVISILSGNTVMPTVTTSKTTTTTTTTPTTANGGSTGGTTASGTVIDWDVNSNFWTEGSNIVSKDANGVTVTKSSGKNLISSSDNNLSAYDGLTFSVTPNDGNQKTTLEVQVGDDGSKTATFAIGTGKTDCVLSFAEKGITPSSSMYIYIRATGGDATNLTISDIMGYTGSGSGAATTTTTTTAGGSSDTTTTTTTAATTTTTAGGSSDVTPSGAVIDWDVNSNFWTEGSNIVSKDANGVTVTKSSGKNLISSSDNNLTAYEGLTFSVTPNDGNQKTTLEVQVGDDGSKTATFAIGTGKTDCVLSFAEKGITPSSSMYIYIRATGGDASNLTISDIMGTTGSGSAPETTTTTTQVTQATTTTKATQSTTTTQGGSSSNVKGDIDNNGAANVSDVLQLKKIISGASQSTPATADVNGDGKISSVDIMELKKLLAVG